MSTFNQQPYFDDYQKEKGFHKVLFIPKKAVQVRELNQIQSIFQNQIQQFGDNIFNNGSMVIPGNTSLDTQFSYVKVEIDNYEEVKDQLNNTSVTITGATSGLTADLIQVYPAEGDDPVTFYVSYTNSGTSGLTKTFGNETLSIYNANSALIATATATACGYGTRVGVNAGVFYINGYFVYVDKQQIILSKYTQTPTAKVGFNVEESFVTTDTDESLYDNAIGTPNYKAPGAHRYAIDLQLVKYTDDDSIPEEFVQIMSVKLGEIESQARTSDYSVIADTLAKRTYDESGDYTVDAFTVTIEENADDSKFDIDISKGLAYVRGYAVETSITTTLENDKARSTAIINNASISAPMGYYVEIGKTNAMPVLSSFQKIAFYSAIVGTPGGVPGGSVIGYANIKSIRKLGTDSYRLYLFNVVNPSGVSDTSWVANAKAVRSAESTAWSANLTTTSLLDTSNIQLVYPLAASNVKTLLDNGSSDTSYTTIKQYTLTTDSSGTVSLIAGSNETFVSQDAQYAFAIFTSGDVVDITGNYTISGSPVGKSITIDFGGSYAASNVTLNLVVAKETTTAKTKTLKSQSSVIASSDKIFLGKADVVSITSITSASGTDVTKAFTLYPNRYETHYDISYLAKTDSSIAITGNLTIVFDYLDHGTGDYFSVDSYSSIDYDQIPTDTINGVSYKLSDVLDFRPRINSSRSGFTSDAIVGYIPLPYSTVRSDVEHYLPRIDKLWVDSSGAFGVTKGEPSLNPVAPSDQSNAMTIYTIEVPAYTADISEIKCSMIQNKRYTMRDIGKLENRISNLEYYVSLNMLELSTATMQITDSDTGLNRFKNGFVVDQFVDHSVGDYTWGQYKCSVDPENSELRPQFSMNAVDLEVSSGSNYVVKDDLIMLPYTETTFLSQTLASSSMDVNPYAVYRWTGSLALSPSYDSWIDTKYTDPAVTYQIYNNGKLTQTWNAWSIYWSGSSSSSTSTTSSGSVRTRTTTTTTTSVKQVGDVVVNTSVIPYMRAVEINVTGKGFRPGAVLYPFFDGQRVSSYVKPSGGSYGGAIKPDASGNVNCTFAIPAGKFKTGTKVLELIDNTANDEQTAYSFGKNNFTSTGVLQIRQKQYIATRSINSTTTRTVVSRNSDPLAQSFLVEMENGVFATSIDVYFAQKDVSTAVSLGVYTMDNGYPTNEMIPGSEVVLQPSEVNVSSKASTATRFTFGYPIHLESDVEYCFILKSNSDMYKVWVARMGEPDISSKLGIAKQPFVGVLFKSQNASTWTADQTADMKFKINRAVFSATSGTVRLQNKSTPTYTMDANPLLTTKGSSDIIVNMSQHNYSVGAYVAIDGCATEAGIDSTNLNKTHLVTEVLDFDRFVIDCGVNATSSGYIGGDEVTITQNYLASHLVSHFSELGLSNTAVGYTASGHIGKTLGGSESTYSTADSFTLVNDDVNQLNQPLIICSDVDQAANLSGKSFFVDINLSTEMSNISPVVDLQNSYVVCVYNEVEARETPVADGSTTWAKYRTNVVGLNDAANSIKTYIDVMKPQEASVYISYRTGNSEQEVLNSDWSLMSEINVVTSDDNSTFYENEWGDDSIGEFTYFQVMIQMRSSSCTKAPVLKRFRTIALGT